MSKRFFWVAFATGLAAIAWVALGFVGSGVALTMTFAIMATYLFGAFELWQYRRDTAALGSVLADIPQPLVSLAQWVERVPATLRNIVRQRIEGERIGLPGPALTPYLVGLLVMLGMLGTFLGMVVTFKGAVFALEGSTDLQAIRAALGEPIRGLGLSFGTSVAGVAASAVLGLMSAISRRERLQIARLLDSKIATVLRPFSLAHQREQTLEAIQAQAAALPAVVDKLEAMMSRIEARGQALDAQLMASHTQFQRDATVAYTGLAQAVGTSLHDSLAAGARAAGESITPVVESAMARIAQDTQHMHTRLGEAARAQVDTLSGEFATTTRTVVADVSRLMAQSEELVRARTEAESRWLAQHGDRMDELASVTQSQLEALRKEEQVRGDAAVARLGELQSALAQHLATLGEAASAQVDALSGEFATTTRTVVADVSRLMAHSEELVKARTEAESRWLAQHGERMDELASVTQSQLEALRKEEQTRGEAAVARLGELQSALAQHLGTLGAALEAPLARLMQTASEVPQAAAGVLAQLRQEMTRLSDQENVALRERTVLVERLGGLVETIERSANQSLEMSAHASANAVELSSLGEGFAHSVQLFQASNDKAMLTLQQIEAAIGRSTARSDEQLAYYVAQAREVIDLSIASQHGVVEHLRQLSAKPPAHLKVAAS